MKNKKLNYILLLAVAAIWGLVIYRAFNTSEDEVEEFISAQTPEIAVYEAVIDSFTLHDIKRDPFLGKMYHAHTSSVKKKTHTPKPPEPKEPEIIIWPNIRYLGAIIREEKEVGLITFNGKQVMVEEKQLVDTLTVLEIRKDSLCMSMAKYKKWFLK